MATKTHLLPFHSNYLSLHEQDKSDLTLRLIAPKTQYSQFYLSRRAGISPLTESHCMKNLVHGLLVRSKQAPRHLDNTSIRIVFRTKSSPISPISAVLDSDFLKEPSNRRCHLEMTAIKTVSVDAISPGASLSTVLAQSSQKILNWLTSSMSLRKIVKVFPSG